MKLAELSAEYRSSAQLCRVRIAELRQKLADEQMCEIDRLRLRRRICILTSMMRDTLAVGGYLENYYKHSEGETNAGEKA